MGKKVLAIARRCYKNRREESVMRKKNGRCRVRGEQKERGL
jgi:hypothetical protein